MKELSIEQKAKAYDEALERVEDFIEKQNPPAFDKDLIGTIFPELKQSEDEKIRREIMEYITLYKDSLDDDEYKSWISWLEKQGEQKPADKVEPKFKVGDWITDDEDEVIFHITSYDIDYGYQLETVNGTSFHYSDETIEKKYRLWTIQDAKDGDVLSYRNGQWIFIFKRRIDKDSFEYYALWSTIHNDLTINDSAFSLLTNSIYPATKEQRDLLFAKMKEAGYKWNAEKKELNKMEQKEDMYNKLTDFEVSLKHVMEEAIECGDTHNLKADADMLLRIAQKPAAWSEEDEEHIHSLLDRLEGMCKKGSTFITTRFAVNQDIDWLKSLKPQNTWKPGIAQLNALSIVSKGNAPDDIEAIVSLYNDLKKLTE